MPSVFHIRLPYVAAFAAMLVIAAARSGRAQRPTPTQTQRDSVARADSMKKAMQSMPGMGMPSIDSAHSHAKRPAMTDPLGVPMDRMGSGTTWIPDVVSLPSKHFTAGAWDFMLHGFVFLQQNKQGGLRGEAQPGSLNWGMFMASHELVGGRFQARAMLSLDPATVTDRGYPLLLQTGEALGGQALHDRQHPHDFLMELGALYERPISRSVGLSFYVAPSGEPALGPVAFMHRPSAMDVPTAPLGHHWQDATHISFGVLTAGVFTQRWKLEGSVFNSREPDEHRWNIDPIRLDSYSGRLTMNPNTNWSFTAGYGYLKSPEALHPDESMHRLAASALHGAKLGANGQWSSVAVWGANKHAGSNFTHSVLLESEAILDRSNTLIGRAEWVQKSGEDLVLDVPAIGLPSHELFNISAVSLGYVREVIRWSGATIGLGAVGTVNVVPSVLEPTYGSRTPLGAVVFLRMRPAFASASAAMGGMPVRDRQ